MTDLQQEADAVKQSLMQKAYANKGWLIAITVAFILGAVVRGCA